MDCPKCGEELHKIEGLCMDRDGIRSARFCNGCLTVFSTHAHGLSAEYVLIDRYAPKAKDRVINALKTAIRELEGE